jgi:putative DNA primase/helicase
MIRAVPPEGFIEEEVQEPERRFQVRTLSKFRQPEIPKLVRGFIGLGFLMLVYGGWGAGKSFFVIDLLCCIAFGDLWRGRKVERGAVVYLAGEAPGSIESRIRAWLLRRGKLTMDASEPPIGVIGTAPDLLNGDGDMAELAEEIEAFRKSVKLPIRLIVFDTLHACAPGSKEDAGDTGAVLSRVRPLIERFECAAIVVHHAGKDSSRGARGSNSIEAAADVIVEVVEDGGSRSPIVRKVRDGEAPELEPFLIDSVVLAQDEGEPVRIGVHELTEPKADEDDPRKSKAREMREGGASYEAIAKALGLSKNAVWKWFK